MNFSDEYKDLGINDVKCVRSYPCYRLYLGASYKNIEVWKQMKVLLICDCIEGPTT